jgi:hypothetical protein
MTRYFRNFGHIVERGFADDCTGTRELLALQNAMICNYNPMACEEDKCMESSPSGLQYFVHSPHATMLAGVSVLSTGQIQEALRANGGVQVLLPLFSQFNDAIASTSNSEVQLPLVSALLGLICSLVSQYPVVQQQMMQVRGFLLVGFLLQHVAPKQLDIRVVAIFIDTAIRLNASKRKASASVVLGRLLNDVLMNDSVWSRTTPEVQFFLYSRTAAFLPSMSSPDAREVLGVAGVLKLLRCAHTSRQECAEMAADDAGSPLLAQRTVEAVVGALAKSFSTSKTPPTRAELDAVFEHIKGVLSERDTATNLCFLDFLESMLMHRGWRGDSE